MQFPLRSYLVRVCTQHIYTSMPLKEETDCFDAPPPQLSPHSLLKDAEVDTSFLLTDYYCFSLYSLVVFFTENFIPSESQHTRSTFIVLFQHQQICLILVLQNMCYDALFFFFDDTGAALTLNALHQWVAGPSCSLPG